MKYFIFLMGLLFTVVGVLSLVTLELSDSECIAIIGLLSASLLLLTIAVMSNKPRK